MSKKESRSDERAPQGRFCEWARLNVTRARECVRLNVTRAAEWARRYTSPAFHIFSECSGEVL